MLELGLVIGSNPETRVKINFFGPNKGCFKARHAPGDPAYFRNTNAKLGYQLGRRRLVFAFQSRSTPGSFPQLPPIFLIYGNLATSPLLARVYSCCRSLVKLPKKGEI
jgi:hypothetical protein